MKSGGRTLTVTRVLVVTGRNWFVFFLFRCRAFPIHLFRQDRRVQGHASRVGGRLFRVCHDRLKHPHLLPHSLSFPRKKEGCSPCTSQFELSPLRTTASNNVGSDVGFWAIKAPVGAKILLRKEISPMFGRLFFELFLSCTLVNQHSNGKRTLWRWISYWK